MSSKLVTYTNITNKSNARTQKITKITPHHAAGVMTTVGLTDYLTNTSREVSSNYTIGNDGGIGLNVPEDRRAWTSSSAWNDHRAVTIEVANSTGAPEWKVSDAALTSLINLMADIAKRNGITKLEYNGTSSGSITLHEMFANTNCPGPYLKSKLPYIQEEVNKQLGHGASTVTPPKPNPGLDPRWVGLSFNTVVEQVMAGEWGNDPRRSADLNRYGYNAKEVQDEVNRRTYGGKPSTSKPQSSGPIKVGDKVRVKNGAKSYSGEGIASFVYANTYPVAELNGSRAVLGAGLNTAFHVTNLIKEGSQVKPQPKPTPKPKPTPSTGIKVGDKVKVKSGAKSYEGAGIASFVYNNVYTVSELKGQRAVLGNGLNTAFHTNNLIKQGSAPSKPAPKPSSTPKVGDMVLVKRGARDYNGGGVTSAWYTTPKVVSEIRGNRAVLDINGWCTAFRLQDIYKV